MVSEWMDHGNINEFAKGQKGVNPVQLASPEFIPHECENRSLIIQLVDATNGLEYMHSLDMVHGDLKGVQFFHLLEAWVFTMETRQIYLSTELSVPAWLISAFQRLSMQTARQEPTPPRSPWFQRHLSCRSLPVELIGG